MADHARRTSLRTRRRLTAALAAALLLAGCEEPLPERVLWTLKFADTVAAPPALGPDGTIYVGSHDRTFCAVSPDGRRLWTVQAGDYFHAPAAVGDRLLVIGSFDHQVYGVGFDGQVAWKLPTQERIEAGAAIAPDGSIYVPGLDDHLYALTADGKLRWSFTAADDIGGSPAILRDGAVVFGDKSPAGNLYCVSPAGRLRWRRALGSTILSSVAVGP